MTDEQIFNVLKAASFNLEVVINQIESLGEDNPVGSLTTQLKAINTKLGKEREKHNG